MNWLVFTLIPPILNSMVNYLDKYLIDKVIKGRGIGSLIIFAALIGLPVSIAIWIFNPGVTSIESKSAIILIFNGCLYVAWVLPYLYALQRDDASLVAPLFQLSSVMALVLGYFVLGESLGFNQLIGCFFVLLGAIGLSVVRQPEGFKIKTVTLGLIALSCVFIAESGVIFKMVAQSVSFWTASFWENVGIFLSSLLLFSVSSYRKQFLEVIKTNGARVVSISASTETIVMAGKITLNYATMLAPVSLVYFLAEGFQPFFTLILGVLLSTFLPRFISENIERKTILHKLAAISVMCVGAYFISF